MAVQKAEQKGEENKEIEMVIAMHKDGITNDSIAKIGRIPIEKVDKIIKSHSNTEGGLKIRKLYFTDGEVLNFAVYLCIFTCILKPFSMSNTYNWTLIERNADLFANRWATETDEKGEAKTFWDEFFQIFTLRVIILLDLKNILKPNLQLITW